MVSLGKINPFQAELQFIMISYAVIDINILYTDDLGVVSLMFRKLSKIISQKYEMPEIKLMLKISSWLWAHVQVSAWNSHKK